jgi:hypothetical protein
MGWFFGLFGDRGRLAERFAKAHGASARDVMTSNLVTVGEDATAEDIAPSSASATRPSWRTTRRWRSCAPSCAATGV